MTNLLYLVSLVVTNWVIVPEDFKRENGTNYYRAVMEISTNTYLEEVRPCTNRTLYRMDKAPDPRQSRWQTAFPPLPTAPANPRPLPTTLSQPIVRRP